MTADTAPTTPHALPDRAPFDEPEHGLVLGWVSSGARPQGGFRVGFGPAAHEQAVATAAEVVFLPAERQPYQAADLLCLGEATWSHGFARMELRVRWPATVQHALAVLGHGGEVRLPYALARLLAEMSFGRLHLERDDADGFMARVLRAPASRRVRRSAPLPRPRRSRAVLRRLRRRRARLVRVVEVAGLYALGRNLPGGGPLVEVEVKVEVDLRPLTKLLDPRREVRTIACWVQVIPYQDRIELGPAALSWPGRGIVELARLRWHPDGDEVLGMELQADAWLTLNDGHAPLKALVGAVPAT